MDHKWYSTEKQAQVKTDKRKRHTRHLIIKAFMELINKYSLSKVTVKEICQKADINRTTFYKHFLDIYDLMDQITTELTLSIHGENPPQSIKALLPLKFFELVYNNQGFYLAFFNSSIPSSYILDVYEGMTTGFMNTSPIYGDMDPKVVKYLFDYQLSGMAALISAWISGGCEESPEDFREIVLAVITKQAIL